MANFSGSLISATFNRVVQLDGTLQDGTGSLITSLDITSSHALNAESASYWDGSATFAVTSSNQFTGSQFFTGSLIPEAVGGNGIYDLGSQTHPWKDLFITTSSLKFVRDANIIASLNGEEGGVRIGNIFIGTGSISIVSGSGDNLTVIGDVVNTTTSGSEIVPVPGDTVVLPTGSISSSAQIAELGFITSSFTDTGSFVTTSSVAEYLPTGSISSSAQIAELGFVTSSIADTGSFVTTSSVAEYLPTGSISSSAQIAELGFVTSSFTDTGSFVTTSSFNTTSASFDERINNITGSTPSGTISSSAQLTALGFISASASGSTEFSGSTSFEGDTSFTGSTIVSGSLTVIDNQGFRVEGNTVLTGSNLFQGTTIITGDSLTINTPLTVNDTASFKNNVDITGSLTVTEGITGSLHGTSSVSLDTLLFDGKDSATFATTGSNTFKASQYVSGSVVIAPSADPGIIDINSTYLFTSASNFGNDECDFYYRNKGILWDQEWIEQGVNSGLIYGGVVSFQASTLYISPGGGLVVNHNASTSSVQPAIPTQVKWGPITSSVDYITSSQYSHIFIDENGDLQQQIENFTPEQYLQKIPLGTLAHLNNATIDSFGEEKQTVYASHEQSSQFIRAFGPLKQQGLNLSDSGSSLGFNVGSGTSFKLGGFYSSFPNNPSLCDTPALESTGKIVRVYQSSSEGGFIGDINMGNFYDTIDPTKYDDGSGTLVNISGSTTTIQRVFLGPTSERFYVYYGQDTYDSISTALNNLATEPFVESLTTSKSLTFIGYIVAQANATDLSNTSEANIVNGGLFRNTAGSSGGGTSTISNLGDITDVNISTPSTGQYLKYNAGIWENANIQYSEVNNKPSGIISSSIQLESLGVTLASGSSTTFDSDVAISNSNFEVTGSSGFEGPVYGKVITVSPNYTGVWSFDIEADKANFFQLTLQPNSAQSVYLTNGYPGQTVNVKITQASTTPGTVNWAGSIDFPDGFDSAVSTGANDVDVFTFVTWDGTNWYATGLKNFS